MGQDELVSWQAQRAAGLTSCLGRVDGRKAVGDVEHNLTVGEVGSGKHGADILSEINRLSRLENAGVEWNVMVSVARRERHAWRWAKTSTIYTIVSIHHLPVDIDELCSVSRRVRPVETVRGKRTMVHADRDVTIDRCVCENGITETIDTTDGDLLVRHGHRSRIATAGVGYW